jgi:hypothetical protein
MQTEHTESLSHRQSLRHAAIDLLADIEKRWHSYSVGRVESLRCSISKLKDESEDLQALVDEKRLTPFRLPLVVKEIESNRMTIQTGSARIEDIQATSRLIRPLIYTCRTHPSLDSARAIDALVRDFMNLDPGWETSVEKYKAALKGFDPNGFL